MLTRYIRTTGHYSESTIVSAVHSLWRHTKSLAIAETARRFVLLNSSGAYMKMQVRKNEVETLAQASTDGATIDGSRCETDITKHPNTHM